MNEAGNRNLPIFADRFRELRGERTQAAFADFLGISRPTVGFYENGDRVPDAIILKQIVGRCGVTSDYLLGLSDNRTAGNADIGAETGLSDEAIRVLKAAHMEKKCYKKYNDYSKYYWSDVLSMLIEVLNYFPEILDDLVSVLTVDPDIESDDVEEQIIQKDEELYYLIYKNGRVLTGLAYRQYLSQSLNSSFEWLVRHVISKNNPSNFEKEDFQQLIKWKGFLTVESAAEAIKKRLQSQNRREEGAKNADNPKEE